MTKLAFIDTETTSLDLKVAEPWEIGLILRDDGPIRAPGITADVEYLWQVVPEHLELANPQALQIGRYTQRLVQFTGPGSTGNRAARHAHNGQAINSPLAKLTNNYVFMPRWQVADQLFGLLDGAVLVGSNVGAYDMPVLERFLNRHGFPATWFYRPIDVVDLVVGWLRGQVDPMTNQAWEIQVPYRSSAVMLAAGMPKGDDAHTALGDCRWSRDAYDKVMTP